MRKVMFKQVIIPTLAIIGMSFLGFLQVLYPSSNSVESGTTPPVYSTGENIRFAVIGDYGLSGQPEADVAALVKSWKPDFVVTTGDNNYPDGSKLSIDKNIGQYYFEFIGAYSGSYGNDVTPNRFFPALGNHDWHTMTCFFSPCRGAYFGYFSLPGNERYYDFTWGPVHFFILDSYPREPDGVSPDSLQGLWLKDVLKNSTSAWNVVVTHHPPFSSGKHGSTEYMQWPYKEWGADVVLAGHDHTYERILVDDFPYIVNGAGGKSLYDFKKPIPESQVRFNLDYGAMLFEANPQTLTFKFVTRTGQVVDQYTLQAQP